MPDKADARTHGRTDVLAHRRAPAKGKKLRVEQVRSGIGRPGGQRRTLEAIGLRHHQDVVVVVDTPSMRGMLFQVRHLVEVAPVQEG